MRDISRPERITQELERAMAAGKLTQDDIFVEDARTIGTETGRELLRQPISLSGTAERGTVCRLCMCVPVGCGAAGRAERRLRGYIGKNQKSSSARL